MSDTSISILNPDDSALVLDNSTHRVSVAQIYIQSLSPRSQGTMLNALWRVTKLLSDDAENLIHPYDFPWENLRASHVAVIKNALAETYSRHTANHSLSAIRGVFKSAWLDGRIDKDLYDRITAVENITGEDLPAGHDIPARHIQMLYQYCKGLDAPFRQRNILIFGLLQHGLRVSELIHLKVSEVDLNSQELKFTGKGRKERTVQLSSQLMQTLQTWLDMRLPASEWLIQAVAKNRHELQDRPISRQAVFLMIQRYCEKVGLPVYSPHDFRRSFVGDLLDAGVDISTIAKLAGHSQVTTTQRYDRRGKAQQRKAVELIHMPLK